MSRNNNSTNIHNAAQRTAAPQYGEPPRKLVLIVEDELPIAEALGFIIEDMGHAVCIVGEGRAALAAIRQHHPDLVFTDLMMPVMTGPDLIAALRASGDTALPIILMSAMTPPAMQVPGATAIIGKPFSIQAIEALVHRFLDQ